MNDKLSTIADEFTSIENEVKKETILLSYVNQSISSPQDIPSQKAQHKQILDSIEEQTSSSAIQLAVAVNCYECNSANDSQRDCLSNPQKYITKCADKPNGSKYVGCRKIDQWVDYDGPTEGTNIVNNCLFVHSFANIPKITVEAFLTL